uniref:Transcription termination factor 3, mitochondrial n=1 Tax=Rhabditophanes sp. KR3021 TaxID=114890 RepID=A0AC35TTJ1_9BILA
MRVSSLLGSIKNLKNVETMLKKVAPQSSGIQFRQADISDFDMIMPKVTQIFLQEQLVKAFGLQPAEIFPVCEFVALNSLKSKCSIIAVDKEMEKLCGFRLQSIYRRNDPSLDSYVKMLPLKCDNIKQLVYFAKVIRQDVWNYLPEDVNTVLYRRLMYVDDSYKNDTLVKKMYEENFDEEAFKTCGLDGSIVEATTAGHRDMLKGWGYNVVKEIRYDEFAELQKLENIEPTSQGCLGSIQFLFKRF